MRNRFNKFYKPVLIALAALTLAVCAFLAVFLGVKDNPRGGGQFETETEATGETVADTTGKTAVALPTIHVDYKSMLTYSGSEQDFRFAFYPGRVIVTDLTYMTFSDGAQTVLYHYENGKVTIGSYPLVEDYILRATNAGTYTVTFELSDTTKYYWENTDGDTAFKKVPVVITSAYPTVSFDVAEGPYFTDDAELPAITLNKESTPGTIKWKEGQAPSTEPGDFEYEWYFTPEDTNNYYHDGGDGKKYTLHYQIDVIVNVTIGWKDEEDKTIYTTSLESFVKSKIKVTGTYTSGKTEVVADDAYTIDGGADLWKNEGSHQIFVTVPTTTPDGEETTVSNEIGFVITAISRTPERIEYELLIEEGKKYKANESLENVKNDLVVTAYYDDGHNEVLEHDAYTLTNITDPEHPLDEFSGEGECILLINYYNITKDFKVDVELAAFDIENISFASITVNYKDEYTVEVTGNIPDGITVNYVYSGVFSDGETVYPESSEAPTTAGEYTITASFTVDENKYETIEDTISTTLTINKVAAGLGEITISGWTYGDAVSSPDVTAAYGDISITYYADYSEEEGFTNAVTEITSLLDVGTYYVKAVVPTDLNIDGEEKTASFTISKRSITVTIDEAVTYKGENLATFTSTVTEGTIAEGNTEGDVYSLTSPADKNVAGIYTISGNILNDNYDITFEGGNNAYRIYQTISVGEGALLGGQVDIPQDGEFTLVVAAVDADKVYEGLEGNILGYTATLYKATGDDVYVVVTDVPTIVRLAIPAGMEDDYNFFFVDGEGAMHEMAYKVVDGGFIEFEYSGSFPMEFVYNAPLVLAPGIPWWVWLIAVLAVIAIIAIIAEVAVKNKRPARDDTALIVEQIYNDEELRRILAEHGKRLADLEDRDDDGFNDPYEGGYNFG